jgi:PadR family transcriptional regulator PadR
MFVPSNSWQGWEQREISYNRLVLPQSRQQLKNKNMDLENAKAQMRKGVLEMCVLAVIAGRETYPPEIIDKLEGTNLFVKEGTLYPLLIRLKNDGLVDTIWREGVKGPPRKYFTITGNGKKFLEELTGSWQQLVHAVDQTIAGNPAQNNDPGNASEPDAPRALNIEPLLPDA